MTTRAPRRNKQPEAALQAASAEFLNLKLPKNYVAIHVPNGAQLAKPWHAKRLKAQGMRPGCPDWLLVGRSRLDSFALGSIQVGPYVYAVELKAPGKYLSPVQKAFHKRLEACGVPVAVCRSIGEIEAALRGWGILP